MSLPQSTIELDQDDITARLKADALFSSAFIPVLERRKGMTISDIQTALGTMNAAGQVVGLVATVLMPRLIPQQPNAPGPQYYVQYGVQVIDYPAVRSAVGGTGVTAETLCQRIRMVMQNWGTGRGQTLVFDGQNEAPLNDEKKVSYIILLRRQGMDPNPGSCATVSITPSNGPHGASAITLACATAGALVYYTLDGTYPLPVANGGTAILYTGPISLAAACTLRAAASDPAQVLNQGDCNQGIFT